MDIEPNCFRLIIDDIETIWKPPGRLARFLRKFRIQPLVVRRLKKLPAQSIQRDHPHGSYTAAILSQLEDYGLRKFLIAFAKQNPEFATSRTQVWQIIGHALVIGSRRESDRDRIWLETWRNHQGCE